MGGSGGRLEEEGGSVREGEQGKKEAGLWGGRGSGEGG